MQESLDQLLSQRFERYDTFTDSFHDITVFDVVAEAVAALLHAGLKEGAHLWDNEWGDVDDKDLQTIVDDPDYVDAVMSCLKEHVEYSLRMALLDRARKSQGSGE